MSFTSGTTCIFLECLWRVGFRSSPALPPSLLTPAPPWLWLPDAGSLATPCFQPKKTLFSTAGLVLVTKFVSSLSSGTFWNPPQRPL